MANETIIDPEKQRAIATVTNRGGFMTVTQNTSNVVYYIHINASNSVYTEGWSKNDTIFKIDVPMPVN